MLSYVDMKGDVVEIQRISDIHLTGLSCVGVHNDSFYLPNITVTYKKAVMKQVSYGAGYIYEKKSASAGPFAIDYKIPLTLIEKY